MKFSAILAASAAALHLSAEATGKVDGFSGVAEAGAAQVAGFSGVAESGAAQVDRFSGVAEDGATRVAGFSGVAEDSGAAKHLNSRSHYVTKFEQWLKDFDIVLPGEEYEQRLEIFSTAEDLITSHNLVAAAGGSTYTLGHNPYSHLTWSEFKETKSIGRPMLQTQKKGTSAATIKAEQAMAAGPSANANNMRIAKEVTRPDSWDWNKQGAVTGVKDQASCGSCWSFSSTGALEGALFVKTRKLVSLSEQMLVDCDYEDAGCNGGLMDQSFDWIRDNGGICAEDDYPYKGYDGTCDKSCKVVPGTNLKEWVDVETNAEALLDAVYQQPVAIAIEADQAAFQLYADGVLIDGCGTNLDHGVLLVGYGSENGVDYWLVKNSWGPSWGSSGFIKLGRSVDQVGGECGILMQASYPVLE